MWVRIAKIPFKGGSVQNSLRQSISSALLTNLWFHNSVVKEAFFSATAQHIYWCWIFPAALLYIGDHIDVELKACQVQLLLSAALQRRIILVLLTASIVWLQSQGHTSKAWCFPTLICHPASREMPDNAHITFPWAPSNNHKLVNRDGNSVSHRSEGKE